MPNYAAIYEYENYFKDILENPEAYSVNGRFHDSLKDQCFGIFIKQFQENPLHTSIAELYFQLLDQAFQGEISETQKQTILQWIPQTATPSEGMQAFMLKHGDTEAHRQMVSKMLSREDGRSGRYSSIQQFQLFMKMLESLPQDSPLNGEIFEILVNTPMLDDNFLSEVSRFRMGPSGAGRILSRFADFQDRPEFYNLLYAFSVAELGFNSSPVMFPKLAGLKMEIPWEKLTQDILKRREDSAFDAMINNIKLLVHQPEEDPEAAMRQRYSWQYKEIKGEILPMEESLPIATRVATTFFTHLATKRNRILNTNALVKMDEIVEWMSAKTPETKTTLQPMLDQFYERNFGIFKKMSGTKEIYDFYPAMYNLALLQGREKELNMVLADAFLMDDAPAWEHFQSVTKMLMDDPIALKEMFVSFSNSKDKMDILAKTIPGYHLQDRPGIQTEDGRSLLERLQIWTQKMGMSQEEQNHVVLKWMQTLIRSSMEGHLLSTDLVKMLNTPEAERMLAPLPESKGLMMAVSALVFLDDMKSFKNETPFPATVVSMLNVLEKFGLEGIKSRYEEGYFGAPLGTKPLTIFLEQGFGITGVMEAAECLGLDFSNASASGHRNDEFRASREMFLNLIRSSIDRVDRNRSNDLSNDLDQMGEIFFG